MSEAVVLGSGGWIPTAERETCCLYLRKGDDVLFVDAGSGLRHAVERRDLLADARSVHVLLTHFHLDHVVGLAYLPALRLPSPPVLWGPGLALYGEPTDAVLARMLSSPFFTPGIGSVAAGIEELPEGETRCGSFSVRTRRQPRHSEPTLALRIDDRVAYCSDTAYDEGNVTFAQGCDVLFHEAWAIDENADAAIHTSARQAGAIARAAGVGRLVLVHVNPLAGDAGLEAAARQEFDATTVARDLLVVVLE